MNLTCEDSEDLGPAMLAWAYSPLGIALVGADGNICAANPAVETYLAVPVPSLLDKGEAEFDALCKGLMLDHRRIEVPQSKIRAIHFIRRTALRPESSPRRAQIAEQLREPLASIYGFTELLIHQNYDEVTRLELTSTMLGEIEVMMDLINRQLDLTQDPL